MKTKSYALLVKTGDAELRALENFSLEKNYIFPIIELTRGRRSKNEKIGFINKKLDKLKGLFKNHEICLDLTTSTPLSNSEIEDLYTFNEGYKKWTDFLISLKHEQVFSNLVPTILVNTYDPQLSDNLAKQVEFLVNNFNKIVYRNSLADDACYDDLNSFRKYLINSESKFIFIIDCEYIAPGAWKSFSQKIIVRINKIKSILPSTEFIIISTSFPNNISDLGKDDEDVFRLNEIDLYNDVKSKFGADEILYGDYGSINPIRNDEIIMSRGWIPRIDVGLPYEIFYKREKRGTRDYSVAYSAIARRVMTDTRFPKHLTNNWGIKQIINCAEGASPGSNPSFWISVRMNIHLEQQIRRIYSIR